MRKNLWPLFFIGIFGFVFGMIVWTIVRTSSVPLHEDKSFLMKYQYVEENFNTISESNKEFLKKYELDLTINNKSFPLSLKDIYYSQRVLEKKSKHKDLLRVGKNSISLYVIDKDTKKKEKLDITLFITKSIASDADMILKTENFKNINGVYSKDIDLPQEGNWNITAEIKTSKQKGYFFLKSNAIR